MQAPDSEDAVISGEESKDAWDSLREALTILEKEFDTIATTLMGTEEFARTASLVAGFHRRLRKSMESRMGQQLARFNMPSRDDIAALGERMMDIDERLVRIEEKLQQMDPQQSAPRKKRPPRTKKPTSKSNPESKRKSRPKPEQKN